MSTASTPREQALRDALNAVRALHPTGLSNYYGIGDWVKAQYAATKAIQELMEQTPAALKTES